MFEDAPRSDLGSDLARGTGPTRYDLADLHRRYSPPPGYFDGYIFRSAPAPPDSQDLPPETDAEISLETDPEMSRRPDPFCAMLGGGATWLGLIGAGLLGLWELGYWALQGIRHLRAGMGGLP